jgi:hypothetical protein
MDETMVEMYETPLLVDVEAVAGLEADGICYTGGGCGAEEQL